MKQPKVKTIDINAYEWFDKVNGNSYFAGYVTVNFGMKTEKQFKMPYEYGYENFYIQRAFEVLSENGFNPDRIGAGFTNYCRENGIILRCTKQENCKKAKLKSI